MAAKMTRGTPTVLSPNRTSIEQVADDVFKIAVPVPFRSLGTVNCYLLYGSEGWDIVDTGMITPAATAAWESVWRELKITPSALRQVVLTHHHPDHIGLAGRFQRLGDEAGAGQRPVRMGAREIEILELIWGERPERAAVLERFFALCGVAKPSVVTFSEQEVVGMQHMLLPFANAFEVLEPGEMIEIGGRTFEVLHTPGHSDGHLAFFDADDGLMLAGDHVLPHITPNIACWPGVEPDPLGRYLDSLHRLLKLEVRLALPGHGDTMTNWVERLHELRTHHEERLARMYHAVGRGGTVLDVAREVFNLDKLDRHEYRMALAETLAHLEHLVHQGRLSRRDEHVWWFVPR